MLKWDAEDCVSYKKTEVISMTTEQKSKFQVDEAVLYACKRIKTILEKIGPRAPGSPEELKAQESMAKELKQWCSKVEIEEFTVHRQAFMAFIPIIVLAGVAAVALYWRYPGLGALVALLGIVPMVLELVLYKQFLDPFFPGHPSHNVIASRKPKGEVKRRIFLVGHADSQYEWLLNYKFGGGGMKLFLGLSIGSLVVCIVSSLLKFILADLIKLPMTGFWGGLFRAVGIAMICLAPLFFGAVFMQNPFRSVPGASDNLSGCYVAIGALKVLAEAGVEFENTELVVMLSGSEEAGLRGAKAYVKAHKEELLATDTAVIALDTFRDLKDMAVYNRDLNGIVKHDEQVCRLLVEAAKNCGHDLPYSSVYTGSTDGTAFTQGGIRTSSLAAMDPTPPRYYHTRLDDYEHLEPEAIKVGLEIVLETVCLYDEKGLEA